MRYYDRRGVEILPETWSHYIRDRGYCIIASHKTTDGVRIEASWLGVHFPTWEDHPRPFAVFRCKENIPGWKMLDDFRTIEECMAAYGAVVAEVTRKEKS